MPAVWRGREGPGVAGSVYRDPSGLPEETEEGGTRGGGRVDAGQGCCRPRRRFWQAPATVPEEARIFYQNGDSALPHQGLCVHPP